jgi:predicted acetyltransferase
VSIHVRPALGDEFGEFLRTGSQAFGHRPTEQAVAGARHAFEPDRSLAAFDGDTMVATAGAFSFELTLPGLTRVPVAAVSYVAVIPPYRRRGILSALMEAQVDEVHQRGEPLAVLLASEAGIYGRFGYGVATLGAAHQIDRASARLARDVPIGDVRLVEIDEAAKILPDLYDRARRHQVGELSRTAGWWATHLASPAPAEMPELSELPGNRFFAVHSSGGADDGYASYRVEQAWAGPLPNHAVIVDELVGLDGEVEGALFSYVLDLDLTATIRLERRPVVDPLRWLLADGRRLGIVYASDWLWVRPVDVAAALAARRYRVEDRLVIKLSDQLCSWNDGAWLIEGGPDGATCKPAAEQAASSDLTMGPAELGALMLGGVAASTLARAHLVDEGSPGALGRADLFFGTEPSPLCTTEF